MGLFSGMSNLKMPDMTGGLVAQGTDINSYVAKPGDYSQLTTPEMSNVGLNSPSITGAATDVAQPKTFMDSLTGGIKESMMTDKGNFDIGSAFGVAGSLGNAYVAMQDQKMKTKQFESNEAFKKWMKDKAEASSKAKGAALMSISAS